MPDSQLPTGLSVNQFIGFRPGPKLLILGAVHGNETCGTRAIERLRREIEEGTVRIDCGTLTMIPITNPLAYRLKRRHGDRNLNRNMRIASAPEDFEDAVANVLCPLLEAHDILLDLHSFHTPGVPFALFGPPNNDDHLQPFDKAEQEEALALHLGVDRFVEGWLETYAQGVRDRLARGAEANVDYGVGTTETIRRYGGMGITLECGQHDEDEAPHRAYRAVCATLSHLAMAAGLPSPPPPAHPEVIRLYKVIDRLHRDDRFVRDWRSFEKVARGDVIAVRHDGVELSAETDGWIVFPNPNAQVDQEWFYLAGKSDRLRPARGP
ncbi:MAG: succinylglutamate desuccinylase/aspartoacylase family protein [Pseudomonadota bacterium]